MKKVIKIILIVIMCFVVAYGIKIAYGIWVFNNVSAEDQLKIIESKYERCLTEGGDDCEDILIWGLTKTLETQAQELMVVVLDKTLSEDERWGALQMFYTFKNEGEFLSKKTGEFYFAIANDKENPESLRETAAKYLLGAKSKDKAVKELQIKVLESPQASSEYKLEAIKAVANSDDDDAIGALIKALNDKKEDTVVTMRAGGALSKMGYKLKDWIPQLLEIALDESKILTLARIEAMDIIGMLAKYYDIKDQETIKAIKPLIEHDYYSIRLAAARNLMALTGEEYEIKQGTDADLSEEKWGILPDTEEDLKYFSAPENINEIVSRISESVRQEIANEWFLCTKRAEIEATKTYDSYCSKCSEFKEEGDWNKKVDLSSQLEKECKEKLIKKYEISENEGKRIFAEAINKNWSMIDLDSYPPCCGEDN